MKICIYGAGAVGGYFGGRLSQAGHDVIFVARGKTLDAIAANGLQVQSISGDFSIHPAKATDRPEEIGSVDLVLCCVKSWQVSDVADKMRSLLAPETVVIPLQNGVEAHNILSQILGSGHVLPGLCKLITMAEFPGQVRHTGADPYLAFGEMDGRVSQRADQIGQAIAKSKGVTVHVSQNILAQLWRKFMLIAPWSGMGALTRSPIGVIRRLPETRELLLDSIREVFEVAQASGIEIEEKAVNDTIDLIDQLPPEGTASMQRDIMEGLPSELNEQSGAIVRYGKIVGIQTPVNRFIYHSLLPLEQKARGE
jgi:2-dehydropantoate 2-reductase